MITLLLLCACGADETAARANEFMLYAEGAEQIAAKLEMTADYGDRVLEFGLDCAVGEGEAVMEVTFPELISGVRAHMTPDKDYLEFDGAILDTGPLDENGLTPLTAAPELIDGWKNGYLASCGERDGLIMLNIVSSDSLSQELYLDSETLTPVYAELITSERAVIKCTITGCTFYS